MQFCYWKALNIWIEMEQGSFNALAAAYATSLANNAGFYGANIQNLGATRTMPLGSSPFVNTLPNQFFSPQMQPSVTMAGKTDVTPMPGVVNGFKNDTQSMANMNFLGEQILYFYDIIV